MKLLDSKDRSVGRRIPLLFFDSGRGAGGRSVQLHFLWLLPYGEWDRGSRVEGDYYRPQQGVPHGQVRSCTYYSEAKGIPPLHGLYSG